MKRTKIIIPTTMGELRELHRESNSAVRGISYSHDKKWVSWDCGNMKFKGKTEFPEEPTSIIYAVEVTETVMSLEDRLEKIESRLNTVEALSYGLDERVKDLQNE